MRLVFTFCFSLALLGSSLLAQAGWQTNFIEKPNYEGVPIPPAYQGKSVLELQASGYNNLSIPALTPTNFRWTDSADADTLGDIPGTVSPELQGHPLLDKLILELNQDPLALAAYVQNEIGLTNAVQAQSDLVDGYTLVADQIMRGALGTYMEKQGSPWEQCALLVHLLRRAGYPAAYVNPYISTNQRGLWMLSRDVNSMLGVSFKEAAGSAAGIRLYFPWVIMYTTKTGTGGEWKQLFPWIKDAVIEEGLNHYDYLPAGYASGKNWMQKYLTNDATINSLIPEGGRDTPGQLFMRYLDSQVAANGLSVEDFGVKKYNRKRQYSNWVDLPKPFIVGQYDSATWTGTLAVKTNDLKDAADASKFATLQLSIQTVSGGTNQIATQNMRLCDLHNRRFYAFYKPGENKIALELSPFDDEAGLAAGNFSSATVLAKQYTEVANPGVPLQIKVDIAGLNTSVSFTGAEFTRPFDANSLTAICFNPGRVTREMLDVHARKFQKLEALATAPPMQDYVGVTMFTAGMTYWSTMLEELGAIRDLHKIYTYFDYGLCLASMTPGTGAASGQWRIPRFDIPFRRYQLANGSIHPYSSQALAQVQQDNYFLEAGVSSANEHHVLNSFFGKENGISTVKLLRLANSRHAATAGNGGQGFFSFTRSEFASAHTDPLYATLRTEAGPAWTAAYNALQIGVSGYVSSGWETVYVTPFDISMEAISGATPSYTGMGLLYIVTDKIGALIDGQASGGVGESFQTDLFNTSNFSNLSFSFNLDGGYELVDFSDLDFGLLVSSVGSNDLINYFNSISLNNLFVDSFSKTALTVGFNLLGYAPSTDLGAVGSAIYSDGWVGSPSWHNVGGYGNSFVSDPVNVINGEFYLDAVDLTLPGPFPLEIRRNYGSQNESLNILGYGWKFSLTPYINITQDSSLIYAADPDGSVVAYRKVVASNPERWEPSIADNPLLNNYNGGKIGGRVNPFNAYVLKTTESTNTIYTLYKPDGNVARYRVRSFPITSGGSTITRQRPYLERWSDAFGNYFTFDYYETAADVEYGQLRRITSTNGGYLGFRYNSTGLATEIFTHDGRRVSYRYDKYGDLIGVTLPDNAATTYEYKILTDAANGNVPYSTHLLVTERKPDGRVLKNIYDPLYDPKHSTYSQAKYRRVKEQWGTVGVDLVPLKFAEFEYNPAGDVWVAAGYDVTYVHSDVRPAKGRLTTTYVHKDGVYHYIADAAATGFAPGNVSLDHVLCNEWYAVGEANGYPRSVKSIKDKRGLLTRYEYDSKGSLRKVTKEGDLSGDGSTSTASTYFYYDTTRYLLKKVIEPLPASGLRQRVTYYTYPAIAGGANSAVDPGNSNYYLYAYLPQKVTNYSVLSPALNELQPSAGDKILEVVNSYGREVTTGLEAHGLLKKVSTTSGLNTVDKTETSWQYSFRGYPTSRTQRTFTTAPDVTTLFEYNLTGELVKETDPAGRISTYEYDLMGRLTSKARYASATAPSAVDWRLSYYNQNGEVVWEDGVHTFPEDYIFRDYDGSGRLIAEVRWRSQAKTDGTGVEEAPNQTAFLGQSITYFEYDGFGNLVSKIDPRGNESRMVYDALGQLSTQTEAFGTIDEAAETYLYEPGGQVRFHVNAKGGETTVLYADNGQPLEKSTPDGRTEQWRYYLDGRLKSHTLSNGATWTYSYDDKLLKETRELVKGNTTLGKSVVTYDTRRNEVKRQEFAAAVTSFVFDAEYDGLNRVIRKAGPPAKTHPDTGEAVSAQQVTTFTYAYGNSYTPYTVEALTGAIKRVQVYNERDQLGLSLSINTATSKIEDETAFNYTDTINCTISKRVFRYSNGAGVNTMVTEHYFDNNGNNILTRFADGKFTRNVYDKAGNLTSSFDELGLETHYTYDARNRLHTTTKPDNSVVTLGYDDAGNLTSRAMPGNIEWQAQYDTANRMDWEQLKGTDTSVSRRIEYDYFESGADMGLLSERKENPGMADALTHAFTYDGAMRVTDIASTGTGYPSVTLSRTFDWRGITTSLTRGSPSDPALIPSVKVSRLVDGAGQLFDELTTTGSGIGSGFAFHATHSHLIQRWDVEGNRAALKMGPAVTPKGSWNPWLEFSYFPAGQPRQIFKNGGANIWALNYFYTSNGLLEDYGLVTYGPAAPYYGKFTSTFPLPYNNAQYDVRGRLRSRTTTVLAGGVGVTALTESFPRADDGKLLSYSVQHTTGAGGSWATSSEARGYTYDPQSRRLATETYKPNPATSSPMETLSYTFDSDKLGVRTKVKNDTDNVVVWQVPNPSAGGLDVFKRLANETEASELFSFIAKGTAVGPGKFSLLLGKGASPSTWEPVATVHPAPAAGTGNWAVPLTLAPGQYTLKAAAAHASASSTYTTQQSNTFTIGTTLQQAARSNSYDHGGRLTSRSWAGGQVVQTFTWDATGQLVKVVQVDGRTTGKQYPDYTWTATYDPLGRRISTTYVDENQRATDPDKNVVKSWYDPQVEFLEVAVESDNKRWWKVHGPDLTAGYGDFQGVGGLELIIDEATETYYPIVDDAQGNVVGYINLGVVTNTNDDQMVWIETQVSGYGPLPGHPMRPLEQTKDILKSLAWQSRRIDPTGFFHMGARYYDPVAGAFISTDPLGHAECMDLYSYADGDPVNYSDPTGRGMQIHSASSTNPISVGGGNHNTLTSIAGTFQPEMPDLNPYPKSFGDRALDYSFAAFELMAIEAMYAVPHTMAFMSGNWGEPAPGYQTWREFVWDTAEIDPNGWGGASLDAGTQLATLYLGYKLTGGGVQTAENAAFNVTRQADGWVTIAHPANADAFIQGRVVAGNLEVGMVNIPGPMQGQGLSKSLYQALANEARGVSSITGELANTNKMVFRDGLDAGLSVQQAAAATPAARARAAAGFTNHSYDPATGVLTSTR